MTTVPAGIGHGEGGSRLADLEALLNDIAADLAELIDTQFPGLLQKLDADAGVTDEDYEATLAPAARKHIASDE